MHDYDSRNDDDQRRAEEDDQQRRTLSATRLRLLGAVLGMDGRPLFEVRDPSGAFQIVPPANP